LSEEKVVRFPCHRKRWCDCSYTYVRGGAENFSKSCVL